MRTHRSANYQAALLEMSDEDLMAQFQSGVVDAFNILMNRHTLRLRNYIWGFIRDVHRAEDLVQEAFVRVHRNRHSYRRIAKFSTWLYTIAGNLARSEYRKRKRRSIVSSLQSVSRDDEEYDMPIPDESMSSGRLSNRTFQAEEIRRAFEQVPDPFREVVVLRDVQELSYEEIAQITALPMGTVKSRINRGRRKLQSLLKELYV